MSYIRYIRSKDGSEVWESTDFAVNPEKIALQSATTEGNRRSIIISQASTILTTVSVLAALAAIIVDILKEILPSSYTKYLLFGIAGYLGLVFLCLIRSFVVVKDNSKHIKNGKEKSQYLSLKNKNDHDEKWINASYIIALFLVILLVLSLLFSFLLFEA